MNNGRFDVAGSKIMILHVAQHKLQFFQLHQFWIGSTFQTTLHGDSIEKVVPILPTEAMRRMFGKCDATTYTI